MKALFLNHPASGKQRLSLGDEIGSGAAGAVYKDRGDPLRVIKVYKKPEDRARYRDKIAAMLQLPPRLDHIREAGKTYVQLAWPTAMVQEASGEFVGFAMPEVNFRASVSLEQMLQRKMRQRHQLPEYYGHRVVAAANLAAVMAELHAVGHYMIDMKPVNMRVYPANMYLGIVDCDGFSVRVDSSRRFPGEQFTPEYIEPEAKKLAPNDLSESQDLFALAVIVFRLLNNGVHPYQGIDAGSGGPTNLQDRINDGLYAYGRSYSNKVRPSTASIHEYFEDETRELFDRAFSGRHRPSAFEWRSHITNLVAGSNRKLQPCGTNADHAHFSKGCGLCALEAGPIGRPQPAPAHIQLSAAHLAPKRQAANLRSPHSASTAGGPSGGTATAVRSSRRFSRGVNAALILAFAAFIGLAIRSLTSEPSPPPQAARVVAKPPQSQSPPPQTAPRERSPATSVPRPLASAPQTPQIPTFPMEPEMKVPTAGPEGGVAPERIARVEPPRDVRRANVTGRVEDVLDTGTLVVGGRIVQLLGVRGLDGGVVSEMKGYLSAMGGTVNCTSDDSSRFRCRVPAGDDVAEAAVLNGAARALPDAPTAYREAEAEAQKAKRGIWAR